MLPPSSVTKSQHLLIYFFARSNSYRPSATISNTFGDKTDRDLNFKSMCSASVLWCHKSARNCPIFVSHLPEISFHQSAFTQAPASVTFPQWVRAGHGVPQGVTGCHRVSARECDLPSVGQGRSRGVKWGRWPPASTVAAVCRAMVTAQLCPCVMTFIEVVMCCSTFQGYSRIHHSYMRYNTAAVIDFWLFQHCSTPPFYGENYNQCLYCWSNIAILLTMLGNRAEQACNWELLSAVTYASFHRRSVICFSLRTTRI